ncbi:glycosyltransferase family 2 protein [Enterovirga sp.]|uniref:glycosyltransferase family 2 protein n=1 Tax=Enterovirga sp. TaxID=2026350 RepID=UPI00260A737D|nr:glycosyltransferase family 2 protein [Enterovirga sp.]MDB5590786.1 dolichol-phosphate mannosyltransferase [Enterovirga sp.]
MSAPLPQLGPPPRLSVVIPAKNEAGSIVEQLDELERVLAPLAPFEVVYVIDGSTDDTSAVLARAARPWLRVVRHAESCGKSAALLTGIRAARAEIVSTLDGDGQNDPAYVIPLVEALERGGPAVGLAVGQRLRRGDGGFKKFQSRIANRVRQAILADDTRDTACGHKVIRRQVFLELPFFDALHRFLPALVKREGYGVVHVDVIDRPRTAGTSHYGFFDRLWSGLLDLFGVWWLLRRRRRVPRIVETRP